MHTTRIRIAALVLILAFVSGCKAINKLRGPMRLFRVHVIVPTDERVIFDLLPGNVTVQVISYEGAKVDFERATCQGSGPIYTCTVKPNGRLIVSNPSIPGEEAFESLVDVTVDVER
jgi:hypothetical protein